MLKGILEISVKGEGRTTIGFGQGERLPPVVKINN
jgi:hypothetical protein